MDKLHLILPYFNYTSSINRKESTLRFIERYRCDENVIIIVAECVLRGRSPELSDVFCGDDPHTYYLEITDDPLWIKESLINVVYQRNESEIKYLAWVDSDITFFNKKWATETIELLKSNDIVQLFQSAVHIGPEDDAYKIEYGFAYSHLKTNIEHKGGNKLGYWHPGFAWACTKEAFEKMGGAPDWAILGSGDRHIATALIGEVLESCPSVMGEGYKNKLLELQNKTKGMKINYLKGTILHDWHGSLIDRNYYNRWMILANNKYDPESDLKHGHSTIVRLTSSGKRMSTDFLEYFIGRNEDSENNLSKSTGSVSVNEIALTIKEKLEQLEKVFKNSNSNFDECRKVFYFLVENECLSEIIQTKLAENLYGKYINNNHMMDASGLYNLGSLARLSAKYDESIEIFKRLLESGNEGFAPGCHYHLAANYVKKGLNDLALYHIDRCLTMVPEHHAVKKIKSILNVF
jgi:tetratricopeptide (TPR) repeat protein